MSIELRPSSIVLPNITVQGKYRDDVLISHVLTANEGYVIYDTAANNVIPRPDPETGEIIPVSVIYYFRESTIPINVPVDNWTWIAVLESEVSADQNFGGGNNNEVIKAEERDVANE